MLSSMRAHVRLFNQSGIKSNIYLSIVH